MKARALAILRLAGIVVLVALVLCVLEFLWVILMGGI